MKDDVCRREVWWVTKTYSTHIPLYRFYLTVFECASKEIVKETIHLEEN
jgi:hypothetical protein